MSPGAFTFALAVIAACAVVLILAAQYRLNTDQQLEQAARRRVLRELARREDDR